MEEIYRLFFEEIKSQNTDMFIKKALEHSDFNFDCLDKYGFSLLHRAAVNDCEEIITYLLENKANLEILSRQHWTPLLIAVVSGARKSTETLIERGANISAIDKKGNGVLHLSVTSGNFELFQMLVNIGANREIINESGSSLEDYIKLHEQTDWLHFLKNKS